MICASRYSRSIAEPGTIPLQLINGESAKTWGVELAADWRPLDWMRFHLAYTFLDTTFAQKSGTEVPAGLFPPLGDERDPMNQVSLRLSFNLSPTVELDLWTRYQDRIPDSINPAILREVGDYVAFDVRLGWRPFRHLELSLVGRNLNDSGSLRISSGVRHVPDPGRAQHLRTDEVGLLTTLPKPNNP